MGASLCTCLCREKEVPIIPENHSGGSDVHGFAVAKNNRSKMEDATDQKDNIAGWSYYGVFDGHGGDRGVTLVKQRFPSLLEEYLKDAEDVESALRDAFLALDKEVSEILLEEAEAEETKSISITSGTTACIALWKGSELFIANLGDCRAVLSMGGTAEAVTTDHAPEKSVEEAKRLEEMNVTFRDGYVAGHLAVSRALGDVCVETKEKVPGVIALPEITKIDIDGQTEFLLMASDGVWDCLKNQHALAPARRALRQVLGPEAAAAQVIKAAAAMPLGKADNSSVQVVVFNMPEPLPKRGQIRQAALPNMRGA